MRFNLNNKWAVVTEEHQVSIAMRRKVLEGDNKGKEYLTPTYYYNNFEEALKGLIDRDIQSLEKVEQIEGRSAELKKDVQIMLKKVGLAS